MQDRRRLRTAQQDADYVPRKKAKGQRPVDYFSSAIHSVKQRPYSDGRGDFHVSPHEYYSKDLLPPHCTNFNHATALCTQWVHTTQYPDARRFEQQPGRRMRVLTNVLQWSPNGRKLLCGTSTGEFLVLNGQAFGVELKTTAHEAQDGRAIRGLAWGRLTGAVLSGDDSCVVKIWGANFNLAAEFNCNQRSLRDVVWAPGELKFGTAGADGTVRIWDAERTASGSAECETKLEGHGGDVHSVQWHPWRALVATGSQDSDIRLWDPRRGVDNHLAVLSGHRDPLTAVRWHVNGREWHLLSASRDTTVKLWDARMMKELITFSGHTKAVHSIEWHPSHPDLFASAGLDGTLAFWSSSQSGASQSVEGTSIQVSKWAAAVHAAHDRFRDEPNGINCIAWSPLGHILASGAGEVNLWTRNKPGAMEEERFTNEDAADIVMPSMSGGVAGQWA